MHLVPDLQAGSFIGQAFSIAAHRKNPQLGIGKDIGMVERLQKANPTTDILYSQRRAK
jgi:hypothetical protein